MRKLSLLMVLVLALGATALARRPVIEVRLVVESGGASFPTQEGKRLQLGPPLVPAFEVTRATANQSEVQLVLAPPTAIAFEDATARNLGHKLAIIVDGVVQSAPVIKDKIAGGRVSVTLRSADDAQKLAKALGTN